MMNENNLKETEKKLEELIETQPEDEYKKKVEAEEADDPEKLAEVRKKLMLLINVKCKGVGPGVIQGQIKPMVYKSSISDCENMIEMIKKKGMYGLARTVTKYSRS